MNLFKKLMIGLLVVSTLLMTAGLAFAKGGPDGHRGHRGHRGMGGEVTAIGESNLTVVNRRGDELTVNVNDETVIHLVETQAEGSFSDIEVGDNIRARGERDEDGNVTAKNIHVTPDGDHVHGRVTSVEGSTITVENRDGETTTITTSDSTEFRMRGEDGASLTDVAEGNGVKAFGDLQDDGTLEANFIFVGEGKHGKGDCDGKRGDRQEK